MKTKEIDVWVPEEFFNKEFDCFYVTTTKRDDKLKAKLIIEKPEKKIEIAESEFDNAFLKTYEDSLVFTDHMDLIKKELGF